MKAFLIISLLVLSIPTYAQGQDFMPSHKNNAYITAGYGLRELYLPLIGSYERMISEKQFENTWRQIFWFKNSFGHYAVWDYGGYLSSHAVNYTLGKKSSQLEVGLGISILYSGDLSGLYHYAALGYRYQKPGKRLIFRTGWGWPEGLYLGAGISF